MLTCVHRAPVLLQLSQVPGILLCRQMCTLPKKESRTPTTCPSLDTNSGDGLERECSRKPEQKLPEHCGVGDPAPEFSVSSHLSSRGRMSKWFWDSAEEGYRTYHMDEYDEDKNPNGIINLGTSENKLCFDLLSSRILLLAGSLLICTVYPQKFKQPRI